MGDHYTQTARHHPSNNLRTRHRPDRCRVGVHANGTRTGTWRSLSQLQESSYHHHSTSFVNAAPIGIDARGPGHQRLLRCPAMTLRSCWISIATVADGRQLAVPKLARPGMIMFVNTSKSRSTDSDRITADYMQIASQSAIGAADDARCHLLAIDLASPTKGGMHSTNVMRRRAWRQLPGAVPRRNFRLANSVGTPGSRS